MESYGTCRTLEQGILLQVMGVSKRTIERSATRSAKDTGDIETTFSTAKER